MKKNLIGLMLLMMLILNGCGGGGGDKEPSDSIKFISDSTIYLKESEIEKFKFRVQASSELSSRLEFQLKGERDAKFFILTTSGVLTFNDYHYNRGERKSSYEIDVVASVVEVANIVNNTTTNLHKTSSKASEKQSITIVIGEKPTSTPPPVVTTAPPPVVTTPTPTPTPTSTPTPTPTPAPTSSALSKWNPAIYKGERSHSINTTNTVKDNYTGLIWQKEGSANSMNWEDAKTYCQNLSLDGYNDWRLPTMEELYYLGDVTRYDPAISEYFNVQSSLYWSATTYKNDSSHAWFVYFKYGDDYWRNKSSNSFALCVR